MDLSIKVEFAIVNLVFLNEIACQTNCKTCTDVIVGTCTSCNAGSNLLNNICCLSTQVL